MFALHLHASIEIVSDWKDVVGETLTTATGTVRAPRTVKIVGLGEDLGESRTFILRPSFT